MQRSAPSLNDRTWLVLPFENTARAPDAELIRQASVPQLYGELSRWEGVHVVSEDRVADLMQQVPEVQGQRLGLEAALGLARRVGAGRLVLGGYLAAGGRANVTARVYETRTGRELSVVRDPLAGFQSSAALDSLAASFGRLARGILGVPAGSANASAGLGTTSIEAYRAYASGMDAINRASVDSALASFDRAVRLDSNFALAHLQRWRYAFFPTERERSHLEAAIRLSGNLPPRERALVEGVAAMGRGERERLCSAANQLVGSDSADAEGWALLSWCNQDFSIAVEDGSPRIRGDLNRSLRAAERAYGLSPNAVSSVQALASVLDRDFLMLCYPSAPGACAPERLYRISFLTAGDSFAVFVAPWADVRHAPPDLAPAAVEGRVRRLRRIEGLVESFALTSNSRFVNTVIARTALAAGDLATAESHLGRGLPGSLDTVAGARAVYLQTRLELALALERPAEFQAYADSFFAQRNAGFLQYRSMLGGFTEGTDTSTANRELAAWRPILAGVLPPGVDTLEQRIAARLTGPAHDDFLQLTTLAGFHLRRTGPALDTAARHPLKRYQAWFARGDTARASAALAAFDRELTARHPNTPDDGGWLLSAESHLELGDTATALVRMQEFGRRWRTSIQGAWILEMRYFQSTTPRLWGRAWLLYGDLAMARGSRDEARRAYRMVVGLWEKGDSPVQPMVARARAALAQLGS